MKQVFLLSFMILSLVGCNSKKEQLCTSTWQDVPIVIDGQNNDWGGTLRYSDTASRLRYDVRNDSDNLYLIVETDDNSMQMKLMHTGIKVSMGLKSVPAATGVITLPAFRENPFMHHCQGMPDSACIGGPGSMPDMKDHKCTKPCSAMKDSACAKHGKEMKDHKCTKPCGAGIDSSCNKPCREMKDQKGSEKGKRMQDSMCHKGPMPGMEAPDSAACMKHNPMRKSATAEGFKYTNGMIEGCHTEKGKISFAKGISNPQTLTVEIAVPLREIYGDGYDLAKIASGKINLEFTVEAIEKPSCPGMMQKEGPMSGRPCPGHPLKGAPDSLAAHHGEGMPCEPSGMHEGKPEGRPEGKCQGRPEGKPEGMSKECMHGAPPEGMSMECMHGASPEGMSKECMHGASPGGMSKECMHGASPEGMKQPFAMPDTTLLLQKQSIQCKVRLAANK